MAVNGVTDAVSSYYNTSAVGGTKAADKTAGKAAEGKTAENTGRTEEAVKYEKSDDAAAVSLGGNTVKGIKNQALVDKMKADLKARQDDLAGIVEKMMNGQGLALAKADDIWSYLAKGKFGTVSEAARAQAQEDISENGYWGAKQTSERILDFAQALVGDDPEKLEKMRDAFDKGFKQATKAWGQDLPELSNQTYKAVMDGFDKLTQKNNDQNAQTAADQAANDPAVTVAANSGVSA